MRLRTRTQLRCRLSYQVLKLTITTVVVQCNVIPAETAQVKGRHTARHGNMANHRQFMSLFVLR